MSATCPEDLLAFVPVAIGFTPADSVVMLIVDGTRPFHARIDLPDDEDDVDQVVEALLRPARQHGAARVVFVVYDDDTTIADETAWSLHCAFTEAGIDVFEVLRVHDDRYFAVLPGREPSAYRGVAFEARHHRFAAQSVFGGRVTHESRAALAATLTRDATAAAQVEAALEDSDPLTPHQVRAVVTEHAAARSAPAPEVVAALVLSLLDGSVRDEAWRWLTRPTAADHVDFWSDVVRRSPEALVPGPAAVLAFTAWLAGQGALAWCAVDRARAVDPQHSLAELVADMLISATAPDQWDLLAGPSTGVA
ncbi:MAG: hypothetical protein AVDCRST_MAG60-2067 [uncultured Nocardioides sp.]|uniref:DUF4192 domain-containing protein n=1 Tax=uncultured Nocardioides sp. TaxID=198441 RepID=A0A6J4NXN8_9ACTN|nr:MAG: hypothetical protein AVDCRST_MAG60-2067 [uncultured Nocardioides sp.]